MNETKERFDKLADDYFDFYYRTFPPFATFLGLHDHDDRLGDYSVGALDEAAAVFRRNADGLSALDPADLEPDDAVDLKMLAAGVRQKVREMDAVRPWQKNPANYPFLAVFGLYTLVIREFAPLETRLASALGRLREVQAVLEAGRENVVPDPPRVFVQTALETVQGLRVLIGTIPPLAESDTLRRELELAAGEADAAATEYAEHFESVLPDATGDFAVGREAFDAMLRDLHQLPYDADSLIADGGRLYAETEAQLAEVAREIDPDATVAEVDRRLKEDHPAADELLDVYRQEMARTRKFVWERGLFRFPEGEELRVEPTGPAFAALTPYAAYMRPAPFEERQTGIFFVTTPPEDLPEEQRESMLKGHSFSKLPVTTLHEGYPGHHLQLSWANRHPSRVRRQMDSVLFAEGWAFYCEELMERLGYSDSPEVRFGRLKDQLWRAARIIIDGSLHTGKMSFDEAVELLMKVGHERGGAEVEVRRYCQTPTQPMSYLIGKLQILSIHDRYKEQAGDAFDLATFHESLLSVGSLTPALAEELLLD